MYIGAREEARRVAREHVLVLHFARHGERLGELVARIHTSATGARISRELLVDTETTSRLTRPGARFEMFRGVFAFDQPGGRGFGAQRIIRLRLRHFGHHARFRRQAPGHISADDAGIARLGALEHGAGADFELVGGKLAHDANAGNGFIFATGADFVVGDDVDRVQVLVAVLDGLLENTVPRS